MIDPQDVMKRILMICTVLALLAAHLCSCDISGVKPPEPQPGETVTTSDQTLPTDAPVPELVATTYIYLEARYADGQSEVLIAEETTSPWALYLQCPAGAESVNIIGYAFFNESDAVNFYYKAPDEQIYYEDISVQKVQPGSADEIEDMEADHILRFNLTVPVELLMPGQNEICLHADAQGHSLDGWVMFDRIQIEMSADPSTTQES